MLSIQLDVTKIDKQRLYKGEKGTYLSAVLIPTPTSKYSDYMIVESVTKEERELGKKGNILGNAKIVGETKPEVEQTAHIDTNTGDDSLPF